MSLQAPLWAADPSNPRRAAPPERERSSSASESALVAPVAAYVAAAVGPAQLLIDGKEPWIDIKPGQRLFAGTDIRTRDRSVVILGLTDGSKLRLGPNGRLRLEELSAPKVAVYVPQGRLEAWVNKNAARAFHARTPVSVVAVHGTVFALSVAGDGKSTVDLFSGRLSVVDNFGKQQSLLPGQRLEASAEGGASRPASLPDGVAAAPEPVVPIVQLAKAPAVGDEPAGAEGETASPEQVPADEPASDDPPLQSKPNPVQDLVIVSPSSP